MPRRRGELLAELEVALLVRRHGARHVAQQLGARLAGEGLQGVQAEDAHALLEERLEQVDGAEAARVDGDGLEAAAARRRQRGGQASRHGVDLVVRHREPPEVGLERRVGDAHVPGIMPRSVSSSAWTPTATTGSSAAAGRRAASTRGVPDRSRSSDTLRCPSLRPLRLRSARWGRYRACRRPVLHRRCLRLLRTARSGASPRVESRARAVNPTRCPRGPANPPGGPGRWYTTSMPIYEFCCNQCGTAFEELVRNGAKPECPECHSGDVCRLLSTFAVHSSSANLGGKGADQELLLLRQLLLCHLPLTTSSPRSRRCAPRSRRAPPAPCTRRAPGPCPARATRQRPHVRRRGAGLPRGPAGPALRRPGRQAARAAARLHRAHARAGLHRQRAQEPAAQQPRPAPGGDRRLPAVPVAADRAHQAQGRLHARQPRDQAAHRQPGGHHARARPAAGDRDRRASSSTCTRSSIPPRRSTRRPCSRRSRRTSCGCRSCWRTPRRGPRRRPRSGRPGGRPSGRRRRAPRPASRRSRSSCRRIRPRGRCLRPAADEPPDRLTIRPPRARRPPAPDAGRGGAARPLLDGHAHPRLAGADRDGSRAPARGVSCSRRRSSPSRATSAPARPRFVREVLRARGVRGAITSPSFTLAQSYRGRGGEQLHHLDLYRLEPRRRRRPLRLGRLPRAAARSRSWSGRRPAAECCRAPDVRARARAPHAAAVGRRGSVRAAGPRACGRGRAAAARASPRRPRQRPSRARPEAAEHS